jgi:UDP-N-acetylglucosamine:LPS N-acetylglucosamine transferase
MKVLAVASGGGHWVQLLRLRPAFAGHDVTFVTVDPGYDESLDGEPLLVVNDANRWNKFGLVLLALRVLRILLTVRPDVVISTGAAPGFFALRLGRFLGARTIWVDSMANVEQLSMSGERIGRHADLWLTQWSHLAREEGPSYRGSVL